MMNYYIGIDVGGTFVKAGIVDENGNIVADGKIASECDKGGNKLAENAATLVMRLLEKSGISKDQIVGAGMGFPGFIDSKNGIVVYSNNVRLSDFPVVEIMQAKLGLKVKVANDANVAALGEKIFGAGKEYNDMVMITLGTGVGAGIIIDGKLFEGNRSAGAEIGHMLLVHGGEQCTCGRKGCFEAYSSATALIRDTRRAMQNHKDSLMWEIGSIDNVTGKTPFDYAKKDKYAAEVVNNYIEMLGSALTDIANIFRPEAIIIGGGVCAQGDNLIVPLKQKIQSELFGADFGSPEVVLRIAELGNKAGLLGAAALFM
ncbi:MAG: ROK family protein [Candidatus Borkfalkiaceae bacterium]|nr:ROK family protein [Christensenellaceae bacterium]